MVLKLGIFGLHFLLRFFLEMPLQKSRVYGFSKKKRWNVFSNKAIVDSRLRPQWCFHLANVTEMEEMLDCKLDALIRSFACEKKRFSWQHKSARITWPLTLTLTFSTPWTQTYLETIVCKFGRDPAICLREVIGQHEIATLATLYTLQRDRLTDKLIAILRRRR